MRLSLIWKEFGGNYRRQDCEHQELQLQVWGMGRRGGPALLVQHGVSRELPGVSPLHLQLQTRRGFAAPLQIARYDTDSSSFAARPVVLPPDQTKGAAAGQVPPGRVRHEVRQVPKGSSLPLLFLGPRPSRGMCVPDPAAGGPFAPCCNLGVESWPGLVLTSH